MNNDEALHWTFRKHVFSGCLMSSVLDFSVSLLLKFRVGVVCIFWCNGANNANVAELEFLDWLKNEDFTLFNKIQLLIFFRKFLYDEYWRTTKNPVTDTSSQQTAGRWRPEEHLPFYHCPWLGLDQLSALDKFNDPWNFWCQDICLRNICLQRSMNINLTA